MNFREWLITHYHDEQSPIGDFARDVQTDRNFPAQATTHSTIADYLESNDACDGCIDAFEKAWRRYAG